MKICPYSRITCDENCGRFDVRTGSCVDFTLADAFAAFADLTHMNMNACGERPSEELKTYRKSEERRIAKLREAKRNQYADTL